MKSTKLHLILVIVIAGLYSFTGLAQETKSLGDTTVSGYENLDNIGGPKSIGAQLEADNQVKEFYFRILKMLPLFQNH